MQPVSILSIAIKYSISITRHQLGLHFIMHQYSEFFKGHRLMRKPESPGKCGKKKIILTSFPLHHSKCWVMEIWKFNLIIRSIIIFLLQRWGKPNLGNSTHSDAVIWNLPATPNLLQLQVSLFSCRTAPRALDHSYPYKIPVGLCAQAADRLQMKKDATGNRQRTQLWRGGKYAGKEKRQHWQVKWRRTLFSECFWNRKAKFLTIAIIIFRALDQEIPGWSVKYPPIQRLFHDWCRNLVQTLKMMQFGAFCSCFLLSH